MAVPTTGVHSNQRPSLTRGVLFARQPADTRLARPHPLVGPLETERRRLVQYLHLRAGRPPASVVVELRPRGQSSQRGESGSASSAASRLGRTKARRSGGVCWTGVRPVLSHLAPSTSQFSVVVVVVVNVIASLVRVVHPRRSSAVHLVRRSGRLPCSLQASSGKNAKSLLHLVVTVGVMSFI